MLTNFDIPYSLHHELQKLDLFLPGENANKRCLFYIHGGGWGGGSRQQWHPVARHFCNLGYVCASTSYRLMPDFQFPAQFEDVRLAASHVLSKANELGFEPSEFATMGSSAGGHLALLLATVEADDPLGVTEELVHKDTRPTAAIAYCPVTSFRAGKQQGSRPTSGYEKLMGATEAEALEDFKNASPIDRVKGTEPSILFIHGDADTTVPIVHSEAMHERLLQAGSTSRLEVLPGVEHGFGYGDTTEAQKKAIQLMADFLDEVFGKA